MNAIPLSECLKGRVYRLHSRNLELGVFDGETGFIGIRTKFDSRYLFSEYHYDTGPPHGTASPLEDLGAVPEGIELKEYEPSTDQRNGRPVAFDRPVSQGGRGWYYLDTGECDQEIRAGSRTYRPLFDYLESLEPAEVPNDRTLKARSCLRGGH